MKLTVVHARTARQHINEKNFACKKKRKESSETSENLNQMWNLKACNNNNKKKKRKKTKEEYSRHDAVLLSNSSRWMKLCINSSVQKDERGGPNFLSEKLDHLPKKKLRVTSTSVAYPFEWLVWCAPCSPTPVCPLLAPSRDFSANQVPDVSESKNATNLRGVVVCSEDLFAAEKIKWTGIRVKPSTPRAGSLRHTSSYLLWLRLSFALYEAKACAAEGHVGLWQ